MIEFKCDGCGKALQVSDGLAGKRGRCPRCKAAVSVPEAGEQVAGIDFDRLRDLVPDDPAPAPPRRVITRLAPARRASGRLQPERAQRDSSASTRRVPILPLMLIVAGIAVVLIWRSGHIQEFAAYSKAQVPERHSDPSRSSRSRPLAVEDPGEMPPPPVDPQRQAAADARTRSLQVVAQQRAALRAFIEQVEPFERELRSLMNAQMVGVNYPDYRTRVQRLADTFSSIPDGAGVPSFTIQDGIGNLKTGNGTFLGYAVSVRPAASAILQSRITILDAWKTGITHPEFGGMDIVRDGFKHNFDYFFSRNDTARNILNYSDDDWLKLFPQ